MTEKRPFQKLDDRLAELPVDTTLHDGITDWLEPALRSWLRKALTSDTAQRVALNLRLALPRLTSRTFWLELQEMTF